MGAVAYIHSQAEPDTKGMIRHLEKTCTEAELLEGCKRADRQMQERFYQQFHGKMLAVCMRYTRDRDTATDIMNRGFLRVFQKIGTYQQTGSLEGWVKVIMVHAISDYYREHNRQKLVYPEHLPEHRDAVMPDGSRFTREALQKALHQLPESQRMVFNLFAVEGYAHKEIAQLLDMNENTVRWCYAEAKKKLQQLLTHSL